MPSVPGCRDKNQYGKRPEREKGKRAKTPGNLGTTARTHACTPPSPHPYPRIWGGKLRTHHCGPSRRIGHFFPPEAGRSRGHVGQNGARMAQNCAMLVKQSINRIGESGCACMLFF